MEDQQINKCIYFPEPVWRTPSLILAVVTSVHLGLSLRDLIKKRFFRGQHQTSLEMSTTTDAKQPGKWKRVHTKHLINPVDIARIAL